MLKTIKDQYTKFKNMFSHNPNAGLSIKFYKDTNDYGEHGRIIVSHIKYDLVQENVAFVFVGLTNPPKLDISVMMHLWDEAEKQGYRVHHIAEYGKENIIHKAPLLYRDSHKNVLEFKSRDTGEFKYGKQAIVRRVK